MEWVTCKPISFIDRLVTDQRSYTIIAICADCDDICVREHVWGQDTVALGSEFDAIFACGESRAGVEDEHSGLAAGEHLAVGAMGWGYVGYGGVPLV